MKLTPAMLKVLRSIEREGNRGKYYAHPSLNVNAKRACLRRGLILRGPEKIGSDGFGIVNSEGVWLTDAGRAALASAR
jgi:hypothetical protein